MMRPDGDDASGCSLHGHAAQHDADLIGRLHTRSFACRLPALSARFDLHAALRYLKHDGLAVLYLHLTL